MKKFLLAAVSIAMIATLAPAHAADPVAYTRTIVAPTTFGGAEGAIDAPSVLAAPTNPNAWNKMATSTTAARCGFLKQTEGVLPAGSAQDASTGKFGYVITLPAAFTTGDAFSLVSHSSNPTQYDFDVIFFSSLGKCVYDRQVSLPAGQGCLTVPLEGAAPQPAAREKTEGPSGGGCPNAGGPKNMYTRIGNDSGTLLFNAAYAVVVMPVGANGKFTLTVSGF